MAIDRQSIEKRDFPIGRRGYDPDSVDAHLALLADEVEQLKRASRGRGDTLASAASEQVRLIVEAAEQSAADIEREADLEARRVRQESREDAEKQRTDAGVQAREHVQKVSEACASMLERIDSMESELRTLVDGLRGGANRVSADLALLQGAVGDLRGVPTAFEAADERVPAAAPGASAEPAIAAVPDPEPEPEPEPAVEPEPEPEPAAAAPKARPRRKAASKSAAKAAEPAPPAADRGADEEGARLIALNMALNGTPREETESYLAENFDLENTAALLDDVYARAGQ